ncbi:MAG: substrate-binding domain-containing protein, partial [Propionibacteriaceae bacterium]|nr:substrate-binding domain-containing protein [Propionibacteriaceae bacterium]
DPITLDNDPAAGVAAFNQLLAEQKPVGVFFTTREAAATILETYQPGEERPVLIGFDAGQAQVEAIRSGVMTGAVAQNPTGIGSILVSVATQWANGKTTSKHVDTGYFWYDNSSIDKENVKAVIDDS